MPRRIITLCMLCLLCLSAIVRPTPTLAAGQQFFSETGHTVSGRFLDYWQQNGGLAQFGLPISEPISEQNADTGKTYTVQYFERNRFEYHPENAAPYNVLLGLLGTELYGKQAPTPQPVVDATLQHALDLINAQRGGAGLAPLRVSSTLMTIAQSYSQVQAQQASISHTGPDGSNPGQRLDRSGYKWAAYGENLATGQSSTDAVVASWMNSPEHRANIMNGTFRDVGVGHTHRSDDPSHFSDYWVLELGAPQ